MHTFLAESHSFSQPIFTDSSPGLGFKWVVWTERWSAHILALSTFNKYLLNIYHLAGMVLGTEDTAMNKNPCFLHGASILMEERWTINKYTT